ncbi:MAG: bifunctional ornithine acetyltransferase/N-acetylglutamate synthase, partial [Gluconobacter cerinus]
MAKPLPVSPLARPLQDLATIAGVRRYPLPAGQRYQGRTDLMLAVFVPGPV